MPAPTFPELYLSEVLNHSVVILNDLATGPNGSIEAVHSDVNEWESLANRFYLTPSPLSPTQEFVSTQFKPSEYSPRSEHDPIASGILQDTIF